jgi:hypothetical protein
MKQVSPLALLFAFAGFLPGCAASGSFPSLAPRAIEQAAANTPATIPMVVIAPSDPARIARVQTVVRQAEAGVSGFNTALSAARQAVGGGKTAGSEGWIAAQVAVSRLERMREPVGLALSTLTAEQRELLLGPESEDRAMLESAFQKVSALDVEQAAAVRSLIATLSRR